MLEKLSIMINKIKALENISTSSIVNNEFLIEKDGL